MSGGRPASGASTPVACSAEHSHYGSMLGGSTEVRLVCMIDVLGCPRCPGCIQGHTAEGHCQRRTYLSLTLTSASRIQTILAWNLSPVVVMSSALLTV